MAARPFSLQLALCALSLGVALHLGACAEDAGNPDGSDEELQAVPPGKADNYYSNVAAEYEMTGTVGVTMTAAEYDDPAVRADKVGGRLTAVGLYLTTYVTDKFRGIDSNNDGVISDSEVFFHNEGYGGFHAMVRNYSLETEDLVLDATSGQYLATFTIDVAGPKGLLTAVPGEWDAAANGLKFSIQMPAGAAFSATNVPRTDIRRFDPAAHTGTLETVSLVGRALPEVTNAYPHFADFMADGVYDLTLFFGHDYNTSRSDLREAEEAYRELKFLGFEVPAADFKSLVADSGPFRKTIKSNGREVQVEVRIFHSDMFTTARSAQHDLALSEVASRDVFFYNGHAGPYYGFYLDAASMAKVDYKEFATNPMHADRQQLIIAQGCQTYSQYADMFYANPEKSEANLDVITTVNYSYGRGTMSVLRNLLETDTAGNHRPVDFYEIVKDLNADWLNDARDVFYGVMGLDGDPQLHPYADLASLGRDCDRPSVCGDAAAHVCADPGDGRRQCGAKALAAIACPSGSRYVQLASSTTIVGGACFADATAPGVEVHGVVEGSLEMNLIIDLVNTFTVEQLDAEVGLDSRAAKNIVAHRAGLDGVEGTADDAAFDSLEELDAVSYVGADAFARLLHYITT